MKNTMQLRRSSSVSSIYRRNNNDTTTNPIITVADIHEESSPSQTTLNTTIPIMPNECITPVRLTSITRDNDWNLISQVSPRKSCSEAQLRMNNPDDDTNFSETAPSSAQLEQPELQTETCPSCSKFAPTTKLTEEHDLRKFLKEILRKQEVHFNNKLEEQNKQHMRQINLLKNQLRQSFHNEILQIKNNSPHQQIKLYMMKTQLRQQKIQTNTNRCS